MKKILLIAGINKESVEQYALDLEKEEGVSLLGEMPYSFKQHGTQLYHQKKIIESKSDVVFYTSNMTREARINFIRMIQGLPEPLHLVIMYHHDSVMINDLIENRLEVEDKSILTNVDMPVYGEGWDGIYYMWDSYTEESINESSFPVQSIKHVRAEILVDRAGYEGLLSFLGTYFYEFYNIISLPHDCSCSNLTIAKYSFSRYQKAWDELNNSTANIDMRTQEIILWAILISDTGKYFAQVYDVDKRYRSGRSIYATYYGYEKVSSQLCMDILKELKFDDDMIYSISSLIQFHNKDISAPKVKDELTSLIGESLTAMLGFFK